APLELKDAVMAAVEAANATGSAHITAWPQLPIFGASIPSEVKRGIEAADVLICDITLPNLNVYYEIGYAIGQGRAIAPVVNASFAGATSNIEKEGLFDIIGYKTYEASAGLAGILADLPDSSLLDLYG